VPSLRGKNHQERKNGRGGDVIKVIVAIIRKPGMSPEAFHAHWRTQHAQLVSGSKAARRYIRRYVQAHTLMSEYANGEPAFDGIAELWFDSIEDRDGFYSDPEYLATVKPDESRFADMTRTQFIVTEEEAVLGIL
jgi:uncharacterized protein (TIGR02118 family)